MGVLRHIRILALAPVPPSHRYLYLDNIARSLDGHANVLPHGPVRPVCPVRPQHKKLVAPMPTWEEQSLCIGATFRCGGGGARG